MAAGTTLRIYGRLHPAVVKRGRWLIALPTVYDGASRAVITSQTAPVVRDDVSATDRTVDDVVDGSLPRLRLGG